MDKVAQLEQRVKALEGQLGALVGRFLTQNISSNVDPASFYGPDAPVTTLLMANHHPGPAGDLLVQATWTPNDPVSGSISWKGAQVSYQGSTYPIVDGSTGTTNFFVWWNQANPNIFNVSATVANLDPITRILVATNASVVAGAGFVGIVNSEVITNGLQTKVALQDGSEFAIFSGSFIDPLNLALRIRTSTTAVGSGFPGIIEVADASGTGSLGGGIKIIATGTDGKIQMATFQVNVANSPGGNTFPDFDNMSSATASAGGGQAVPATVQKYIIVTVDGTQGKIPVFAP